MHPLGIYIHIPFCIKKCGYCDFTSYGDKFDFVHQYADALGREIEFYSHNGLFKRYTPVSLYIGGGTPSLVSKEIVHILATYSHVLHLEILPEKTIEVNPGAVTSEQLGALHQAGFNRLSIGIQSFNDEELRTLGRIHSEEDALLCIQNARKARFQNISIDLMFGIPNSTPDDWERSLHKSIALHPEHISLYDLTIEVGTFFEKLQQQGRLLLPKEDVQLAMYEYGIRQLSEAGYEQYEISNFARPGFRCAHNQIYWRNDDYLGLGAAAHSYMQGRRYWNTPEVVTYIVKSVEPVEADAPYPATVTGEECLDLPGKMGETIMMNLRMRDGIDLNAFEARFGTRLESVYDDIITPLIENGLLEIDERHLRITQRGVPVSNSIFQEFLPQ